MSEFEQEMEGVYCESRDDHRDHLTKRTYDQDRSTPVTLFNSQDSRIAAAHAQVIETLEARLQDGFTKICEAMSRGIEQDNWERHWIELLREYELLREDELGGSDD